MPTTAPALATLLDELRETFGPDLAAPVPARLLLFDVLVAVGHDEEDAGALVGAHPLEERTAAADAVPLPDALDALADRIEDLLELEHGRGRAWSGDTLREMLGEVRDRLREFAGCLGRV